VRKLFTVAVVVLLVMIGFVLLAPQTPDGTWINEAGQKISDGLRAFWGNPIAP
jgi:preprotein translocase subunit SecG